MLALLKDPIPTTAAGLFLGLIGQVARQCRYRLWPNRLATSKAGGPARQTRLEAIGVYALLAESYYYSGAEREHHLRCAGEIFARLDATYDLERVRDAAAQVE